MTTATVGLVVVLMSSVLTIGADTMVLVALGDSIIRHGSIPVGVPFAAADSNG